MSAKHQTKQERIEELGMLRKRIADLEYQSPSESRTSGTSSTIDTCYRTLFEESRDAIYITAKDGSITDVNPAATELFGYTRKEILGANAAILYKNPADRDRFLLDIERLGAVKDYALTLQRKNGEEIVCLLTSSVRHAEDGSVLGYQGIIRDITEQRLIEERLRKSEEKFSTIFHHSPDWIVISTLDNGILIDVNEAFERITGYARSEIVGKTSLEINLWADYDERTHVTNVLREKGEIYNSEVRFRMKSGEIRTFLRSAEVIELDGIKCIINVTRDISERKRIEKERQRSENRYRALLDKASDAIFIADPEGHLTEVNKKAEELLGYNKEELLEMHYIQIHPLDIIPRVTAAFREIVETGTGSLLDAQVLRKDGSRVPVDITGSVIEIPDGQLVQGIFRDITERKHAEEKIRKLNEELIERVVQLTDTNRELDAFTHSVSHDLRTPLIVIGGFCRVLNKDFGDRLDNRGREALQIIQETIKHAETLIADLLSFSRSGRQTITHSIIEMTALAESVFSDLRHLLGKRTLSCIVMPLPQAQGDRVLIRQVLTNLLSNAIKFTSQKDVGIIEVNGRVEGNECIYSVKDNGEGFDMAEAGRLFGVFQRLHHSQEYEGSGIGLSIIERIVRRHGGRVWAEGQTGAGATFYFALPQKKIS